MILSGAPFLDEDAGRVFIQKLWADIAADIRAVDSTLEIIV
jgi:hypothetical protein